MSELYNQAILDARKLREVAELDARNKIIEAVTPYIKKIIAKEAAEEKNFIIGEEDMMPGDDAAPIGGALPPEVDEPTITPGDMPNAAPISPADSLVGMPMPDDEGKITVDFQQLFSMGGGNALAAPPTQGDLNVPPGNQDAGIAASPEGSALGASPVEVPPVAPVGGGEIAPPGNDAGAAAGAPGISPPAPVGIGGGPAPGPAAPAGIPGGQAQEGLPPEEEQPVPVIAGEARVVSFQDEVRLVAEKIDYLYFRGSVPSLVKESVKSRLFTLCEKLDEMVTEDVISSKKARLAENKLEFLFMKLNEAEQQNSYEKIKGAPMTSLKEFAAKLFEEDALGPATADKATAHAEKVSGVGPGVDLFKEGDAPKTDEVKPAAEADKEKDGDLKEMTEALLGEDAPASTAFGDGSKATGAETASPKVHDADALIDKKGAGIVESAPASTAFGDGSKVNGAETASPDVHNSDALIDKKGENSILEFDEKELREAVAKLRKENMARKLAAVKEAATTKTTEQQKGAKALEGTGKPKEGDQGSAKPVGGKAPAQEELKECGMPEADMAGADAGLSMGGGDAGGSDMPPGMGGEDMGGAPADKVEVTFEIDVDDLEALLNGAAESFVAEPEGEAAGMGDESVIDIDVDSDDPAGEGEAMLLKGEDEPKDKMPESKTPVVKEGKKLNEAAVIKKAAVTVKTLQSQLSESRLLTAKALYVSKFAVREDLTTKQKQKIAEYFDKAKTLAEAKATYAKIKKILAESATSTKLSGSASQPTSTGSAKLNESTTSTGGDQIETARWKLLAGIKSKK